MVDGVLHNACMRIRSSGDALDELIRSRARRQWFGRSGLAVGGAASLAVGAVLGGVLEGVPVLLPPTSVAAASPQVVHGNPDATTSRSQPDVGGLTVAARAAADALSAAAAPDGVLHVPPAIGAPAGAGTYTEPGADPSSSGSTGIVDVGQGSGYESVEITGSGGNPSVPGPSGVSSSSENLVGQALNAVTEVASGLPVLGATAAGVVGTVSGLVDGVTSTVTSAGSTGLGSTSSGGSSGSPLSGVTSAANGAVNCVAGVVSGSSKNCNSVTSAIGLP